MVGALVANKNISSNDLINIGIVLAMDANDNDLVTKIIVTAMNKLLEEYPQEASAYAGKLIVKLGVLFLAPIRKEARDKIFESKKQEALAIAAPILNKMPDSPIKQSILTALLGNPIGKAYDERKNWSEVINNCKDIFTLLNALGNPDREVAQAIKEKLVILGIKFSTSEPKKAASSTEQSKSKSKSSKSQEQSNEQLNEQSSKPKEKSHENSSSSVFFDSKQPLVTPTNQTGTSATNGTDTKSNEIELPTLN